MRRPKRGKRCRNLFITLYGLSDSCTANIHNFSFITITYYFGRTKVYLRTNFKKPLDS